jgi:CHAT domain-containing protein
MNWAISSYAPSLKALSFARNRYKQVRSKFKQESAERHSTIESSAAAVIAMHETPARQPLEYSQHEADKIAAFLPDCEALHQPTTQDALKLIGRGLPIVHFSCHGETNYDYPSQSALLMADWEINPLTVSHLQLLDVKTSQLAFLSACFTANAGVENLQDEMAHVAGALQIAGFPNVVGSLWYVGQEAALAVVEWFYKRLCKCEEGLSSRIIAEALHFAVLDFSETTRTAANRMKGNPVSWAPFVHFGI